MRRSVNLGCRIGRLAVLLLIAGCAASVPSSAARVSGRTFDGELIPVIAKADKPTVIVFWATWCDVCRDELPKLLAFASQRGQAATVVGINVDTDVSGARRFVEDAEFPYRNVSDPALVIADTFGVTAMPTVILFDEEGNEVVRDHALEPIVARLDRL